MLSETDPYETLEEFFLDKVIDEVLGLVKSGKEAIVYLVSKFGDPPHALRREGVRTSSTARSAMMRSTGTAAISATGESSATWGTSSATSASAAWAARCSI